MNTNQLTGISTDHTVVFTSEFAWCDSGLKVHRDIVKPLHLLCKAAFNSGNKLALLSGYRSYQRQIQIWEMKNSGESNILDDMGFTINNFVSDEDKFNKIARWSALPGLSRHHWGTDIDVFSADAIDSGYKVELIEKEFTRGGPCENLNNWMQNSLSKFSFSRPYLVDTGGIAPEPWHISYDPLAAVFKTALTSNDLDKIWSKYPWCGSEWATSKIEQLFQKYV